MLKQAAKNEDHASFDTILEMALKTWPKDRNAVLKIANEVKSDWMKEEHTAELAKAKADAEAKEKASRARGIIYYLDPTLWNGQAQLGAGTTSGDTQEHSVALGLSFKRNFGKEWEHHIDFAYDFARSAGETTRRRFDGKYEMLWKPWPKLYLDNYTEYEQDRFSGYAYRITENLGLGYRLIESKRQSLRVEAGPGVRLYRLSDTFSDIGELIPGYNTTEFLGRVSATYELQISDSLNFKNRAAVIAGTDSTSLENFAQLSARINAHLAARLTFQVNYDSPAPEGTAPWDTATRITLVYGF
ncbi:DUF481 domain-containing protein [Kordiimonas marina]|uniref:DUF481 domain-containing protein n=1 Tax=Kordiimonas marina TaxID=2872312 RepID=UPI001FF1642B|nr:DUF481 domain-containing protein [Kordiimonas marina]MCJ9429779.1 DUF481 domain-containing protein [Kordiimonas marina]